jgi:glycosyltransferase involved in cell wall biosynthesis
MKIALVSYEYPPDTALGGIGTYNLHAARILHQRGHHVEVFCASLSRSGVFDDDGIAVHRLRDPERRGFSSRIAPIFAQRHAAVGFDVAEAPEYYADGLSLAASAPDVALVVRLQTPSYLLWRITFAHSRWNVARNCVSSLRRRELPPWHPHHGPERAGALAADEIVAPCRSIAQEVTRAWGLDPQRVAHVPCPYIPSAALLDIEPATQTNVVTFIGRLETRKGVLDLARAIPKVLSSFPNARFRFIGRSVELAPGLEMIDHLRSMLSSHADSVEFPGPVPLERIPSVLSTTDICVFPSIWENFPNVCLEAMSAARGIVGSSAGGMSEMLDLGRAGLLVEPRRPELLADAIIDLLAHPRRRIELGRAARARVLSEYSSSAIAPQQEASYARAIAHRRANSSVPRAPRRRAPLTNWVPSVSLYLPRQKISEEFQGR